MEKIIIIYLLKTQIVIHKVLSSISIYLLENIKRLKEWRSFLAKNIQLTLEKLYILLVVRQVQELKIPYRLILTNDMHRIFVLELFGRKHLSISYKRKIGWFLLNLLQFFI